MGDDESTSKEWKVDSDFYKYPHIADAPPLFDPDKISPVWTTSEDGGTFGKYPHPQTPLPVEFNPDRISPVWITDPSEFYGYPHPGMPIKRDPVSIPWVQDPLIVYGAYETEFKNNGMCILSPTQAEYTINKDEAGSIHVVHPIDPDGAWKHLKLGYIILAPVTIRGEYRPQPFRIYRIVKSRSGGTPSITVDALHVFYDLNYDLNVCTLSGTCNQCIQKILTGNKNQWKTGQGNLWLDDDVDLGSLGGKLASEQWKGTSDMRGKGEKDDGTADNEQGESDESEAVTHEFTNFEGVSFATCLVGSADSIASTFGGSLFVDKFRFSINKRRETSLENCFNLEYGSDMIDITETIDNTNTFSRLWTENTTTGEKQINFANPTLDNGLPFHKTIFARVQADDDIDKLLATAENLDVSYQASIADLPELDMYTGWKGLATHEIGDTGHVIDVELGIDTIQEIVGKKVNLLTGETMSITLGNTPKTIVSQQKLGNTVTTGEATLHEKQVKNAMRELLRYWEQLEANYTWDDLGKFTWGDCGT